MLSAHGMTQVLIRAYNLMLHPIHVFSSPFFYRYVISCYFRGTLFEHLIVCNQDGKSTINHRHFGTFATIDQVTPSPSTQPSNVGDAIATDPHSPPSTSSSPTHPSVSVDPPSILTSLVCAVRSCTCTCICCCSVH